MKKFIAFVLCLVMALGCCSALASGETYTATSDKVNVEVKKYALTATVNDDLIFWDESSNTSTVITVKGGDGTRHITTSIRLLASNGNQTDISLDVNDPYESYEIKASDFRALLNEDDKYIEVSVKTVNSRVTKNGVTSDATEIEEARVLVMNSYIDPETTLVFATTSVDASKVYPGDIINVTGKLVYQELATVIGTRGTVSFYNMTMYTSNASTWTNGEMAIEDPSIENNVATATVEYLVPDADEGTIIEFWTVGTITITE